MSNVLYSYLDGTFEYGGLTNETPDPLEPGVFHAPRNTTPVAPLDTTAGHVNVWNLAAGVWSLVPDHRGETWFDGDAQVTIEALGDPTTFTPPLALAPPPPPPVNLKRYASAAHSRALAAGQVFNVAPDGQTAVPVLCDGLNSTRADLALMVLNAQDDPNATQTWVDNNGLTTILTGPQIVRLAKLAGTWMSQTYPTLGHVLAGLTADPPTITTTAQIDSAFAS